MFQCSCSNRIYVFIFIPGSKSIEGFMVPVTYGSTDSKLKNKTLNSSCKIFDAFILCLLLNKRYVTMSENVCVVLSFTHAFVHNFSNINI